MNERKAMAIWIVLLAVLGVSLVLGSSGYPILATVLIFALATFKAWLVVSFYMGMKWEPWYIVAILLGGVGLMILLYFVLVPDIIYKGNGSHGY